METKQEHTVEETSIATEIIKMLKKELRRMYTVILIFIVLLVISIIDSLWQRHEIIKILDEYEIVEETTTETTIVEQESGDNSNNNYINGNGNKVNN